MLEAQREDRETQDIKKYIETGIAPAVLKKHLEKKKVITSWKTDM